MTSSFKVMERFMDAAVTRLNIPGMDCIVYKNHRLVFRHGAGYSDIENKTPVRLDALYNIYSATKIIVCTAALQLFEKGLYLLSDPLYTYLPEFKDMKVKYGTFSIAPAKKPIKIIDLFKMTAGFSYEVDTPVMRKLKEDTGGDFNTREFVQALSKEPLQFEPGEGWSYSFCHDILGALIEVLSGMSLGEYLKENIFGPLGMKDTGFTVPPEKAERLAPQYMYNPVTKYPARISNDCLGRIGLRHESGGAGLITSVDDYILFVDALACGGAGANGERIISERTISFMSQNRLDERQTEGFRTLVLSDGIGYGLGVAVNYDPIATGSLLPEGSFFWGGYGGAQNLVDTGNKLSFFLAMHNANNPTFLTRPHMMNILYSINWEH